MPSTSTGEVASPIHGGTVMLSVVPEPDATYQANRAGLGTSQSSAAAGSADAGTTEPTPKKKVKGDMRDKPSQDELREIREVFDLFDPGGTGVIDSGEARHSLRALGFDSVVSGVFVVDEPIDFKEFKKIAVHLVLQRNSFAKPAPRAE